MTELIAGDPAAAEQNLRQGYEALSATGERGHCASIATWLAEAVYAQGRFDEALRLTEEAEALAGLEDSEAQGRWRATRAKLLAQRGQFPAAARLAEEAVALFPATFDPPERAEFLLAKAEVARLRGALGEAEACARQALRVLPGPADGAAGPADPRPARQPRHATLTRHRTGTQAHAQRLGPRRLPRIGPASGRLHCQSRNGTTRAATCPEPAVLRGARRPA